MGMHFELALLGSVGELTGLVCLKSMVDGVGVWVGGWVGGVVGVSWDW